MKKTDLLKAINDIDDDLIMEAAPARHIRKPLLDLRGALGLLSAAAAVIVMTVVLPNSFTKQDSMLPNNAPGGKSVEKEMSYPEIIADELVPEMTITEENTPVVRYYDSDGEVVMTLTREEKKDEDTREFSGPAAVNSNGSDVTEDQVVIDYYWENENYFYHLESLLPLSDQQLEELKNNIE